MSEDWLTKTALDLASKGLSTVLCLGRNGSEFINKLPAGAAKRIVVLEPDAETTRPEFPSQNSVDILPFAFAASDGGSILLDSNFEKYSSLRQPTGLKSLFPSLRNLGKTQVSTCSAESLIQKLDLDGHAKNLLILGAPGEELSAVTQFIELGALAKFDSIVTTLPREEMFENASDGAALEAALAEHAFLLKAKDNSDPDLPTALLERDAVWSAMLDKQSEAEKAIEALQQERETLQNALETAEAAVASKSTENATLLEERDGLQNQLDSTHAALDTAKAETAQLTATLENERQVQQTALDQATQGSASDTAEAKRVMGERDKLLEQVANLQKATGMLQHECDTLKNTLDSERDHFSKEIQNERNRLIAEKDDLAQALEQAQNQIQSLEAAAPQGPALDVAKINTEMARLDQQLSAFHALLILEMT